MAKFSIVTVAFNNLAGLQTTYSSLIEQTYKKFEWIVIDGGSADGSKAYIESVANREEYNQFKMKWISEKDNGIYHAMNKGINFSNSEYTLFLNSGDSLCENDVLLNVARFSENYDPCSQSMLYGNFYMLIKNNKVKRIARLPSYLDYSLPTSHQAIFYPTKVIRELKYSRKYIISNDYYITCKAHISGVKLLQMDALIANFSVGGTSMKNFLRSCNEAFDIQVNTLRVNILFAYLSWLRRVVTYLSLSTLYLFSSNSN